VISVASGANGSQLPIRRALLLLLIGSLCLISSSVQEKVLTFGSVAALFHGVVHRFCFPIASGLLQEEIGFVLSYRNKKLDIS
jgi:hydrogenase/urease accessory protein HupE